MAQLSLASVNIERSKHLDRVCAFIQVQQPEVVCMQELMEYDIPYFEEVCGGKCYFTPLTRHPADGRPGIFGTGIFSKFPVADYAEEYYVGSRDMMHDFDSTDEKTKHESEGRAIAFCDIEKEGQAFRIATTHFTWTPKGLSDDFQRQDLKAMLAILDRTGEFVLCGDFNAPRGGEIFTVLAAKYKDNIPLSYTTSLDPTYHRAPLDEQADKMVDGLFTTPAYTATDVALHTGISDHQAVTATISRA